MIKTKRKQFEIIDTRATDAEDVFVEGGFFSRDAAQTQCDNLNKEWLAQISNSGASVGPYVVKPVRTIK